MPNLVTIMERACSRAGGGGVVGAAFAGRAFGWRVVLREGCVQADTQGENREGQAIS